MALPFLNKAAKKRDHIVAVDLGSRTTKAVYLQRKGETFSLVSYVLMDAPLYEKAIAAGPLTDHLKTVTQALGAKTKLTSFALGVNDSLLRHAEVPFIPLNDLRLMIKAGPKTFLQQDLPQHVFDCNLLPPKPGAEGAEKEKKGVPKFRALVGGAKELLVNEVVSGAKGAGLTADQIVPGLVGPVNAFEAALPDVFAKEVVALVDIGFKNSTIIVLMEGELVLTRVVGIGGDKITSGLAETMGITYPEAEGIKIGMAGEVQSNLEPLIIPLGRELRASIDFFEHQQDKTVGTVYVSGAAARSEYFLQVLQNELMVPCKTWNPTASLQLALPSQMMAEVDTAAPLLAVAIGTAACLF